MKEIIAFFIVSGGVGFFNLYLAQETDFLYFGKYNKEERIAWLSIFTFINYLLITDYIRIVNGNHGLFILITTGIEAIVISLLASFVLPKTINWIIKYVRHLFGKPDRSYLPPINSFFEDIDNSSVFVFGFDGEIISSGEIWQGTEERQSGLSMLIYPTDGVKNVFNKQYKYHDFVSNMFKFQQDGKIIMTEYSDFDRKIHIVKIQKVYKQ